MSIKHHFHGCQKRRWYVLRLLSGAISSTWLYLFYLLPAGKHHISSSRSDVRRAIFIKLCMVIEVVRAIILGPIIFWVPSTLPLGVVENLAIRSHQSKLLIILSFIEIKQPNLAQLCRLRKRINDVNFV